MVKLTLLMLLEFKSKKITQENSFGKGKKLNFDALSGKAWFDEVQSYGKEQESNAMTLSTHLEKGVGGQSVVSRIGLTQHLF